MSYIKPTPRKWQVGDFRLLEVNNMRVIKVEPHRAPKVIDIEGSLPSLQEEVGGCIECTYPFDDMVGLICNEEGKLLGLDYNRALRDEENKIYDIICGSFLVVGLTEDDFGSLTEEQIEKYMSLYSKIEEFLVIGDRIISI